jgi:hypothetical protein
MSIDDLVELLLAQEKRHAAEIATLTARIAELPGSIFPLVIGPPFFSWLPPRLMLA